jgi:protein-tyrosine phosphatase
MSVSQILPNLWLGNIFDSRDKKFLKNIDIIINCTKTIPFNSNKTKNIRIFIDDNLKKEEIVNMYKYLESVTDYIYKNLKNGKNILIHCHAGKQRSATVVCAFIIRFLNISYINASILLKSKRNIVFKPLSNFDAALQLFEKKFKRNYS